MRGLGRVITAALALALLGSLAGCSNPGRSSDAVDYLADIPFDRYLSEEEPPAGSVNILDFGAAADQSGEENAAAINAAIDQVSAAGGGTVLVPEGEFVSGTVVLKDNVELFVQGTLRSMDYDKNRESSAPLSGGFLYANGAKNITITGGGRIHGSGETFCDPPAVYAPYTSPDPFNLKSYILGFRDRIRFEKRNSGRVNLVQLENCENVSIHNIEFYQSAAWTCHILQSDQVDIHNLVINNNYHVANTDGIDIACSQDVTVRDCFIATGDDGLCIKADGGEPVRDILIEDCEVMSLANCFKIGTTVYQDVSDVTVRNCRFFLSGTAGGYAGISIQSDCGATVSDIAVENITMDHITAPFLIWLGDRNGETPGAVRNIRLANIQADGVDLPSAITGTIHEDQEYRVEQVELENIRVRYRDCQEDLNIRKGGVGYASMSDYPEITRVSHRYIISHKLSFYWDLPVYGLFARHVDGLNVKGLEVIPRSSNTRPADNITDPEDRIDIQNCTISA